MAGHESAVRQPDGSWWAQTFGRVAPLGCIAALGLGVFWGVLFQDRQFAFRDAGAYYYPLHQRVQQEWDAGRWPLWNPEANAGTPLLGNPTAAVLYPGKLIFFLLPYPWAARAYLIAHVLLALGAMWLLLRAWHASPTGRTLGRAYAFGAPILTQTGNVIFLVGAAWAPLGFLAADRWLRLKRRAAVPGLALVLAMQVLGGDPEAAYVTVIAATGYAAGLAAARAPSLLGRLLTWSAAGLVPVSLGLLGLSWWQARALRAAIHPGPEMAEPWWPPISLLVITTWAVSAVAFCWRARRRPGTRGFGPMFGGLFGASVLALALAGAQLLPVLEFTRQSFRAVEAEGLHNIYPFSMSPFQLFEAIWPDLYGTTDRGNRSWFIALPPKHEDNVWMPSIYLGGLTLVLAAAGAGFRDGPPGRAWLTGLALVSLLAALGAYGSPLLWARMVPGWGSRLGQIEPPGALPVRNDGCLPDGDGSVYWLLASAVPFFGTFRYPAKFLVFTALSVSGLAGLGWDRLASGWSRVRGITAGGLLLASLAALAVAWLGGRSLRAFFAGLPGTTLENFGPLDVDGAIADLRMALGQGTLAFAAALGLAVLAPQRRGLAGAIAVAVLALDLGLANARHVVTVPQGAFEGTPRIWKLIGDAEKAHPTPGPFRIQRVSIWWPKLWSLQGSPRRTEEITRWERGTLRSQYPLPLGIESTFSFDSTELHDYGTLFLPWPMPLNRVMAVELGLKPGDQIWYYPRRSFDMWNTRYFIVPSDMVWDLLELRATATFLPRTTGLYPPPDAFDGPEGKAQERYERSDDVRLLRNEAALPRAWIVHRARLLPPSRGLGRAGFAAMQDEMLFPNDEFWHDLRRPVRDLREMAWVETDRRDEVAGLLSRAGSDPAETVTITRTDPQCVELRAVLHSAGLVVLADVDYPGWTLTVDGRPAEILRTNRAMRGAALPAGTHHLVYRYQPLSFRLGLGLSLVGLIVLMVLGGWAYLDPNDSGLLADRASFPIAGG